MEYKYDKNLYISKGFLVDDDIKLTTDYGKTHDEIAKRYVEENYLNSYKNDFINDYKDYMLMRLHSLMVLYDGKPIISYCDDHLSKYINTAIASYILYGWKENIIPNPTVSTTEMLRFLAFTRNDIEALYVNTDKVKKYTK